MEDFLSVLRGLLDQSVTGVTIKLFLTSRNEGLVVNSLKSHAASITVTSAVTRNDVETYVRERLGKLKEKLRLNADAEKTLQEDLVDRAEGMFLWAELAIKDLEKAHGLTAKTLANRVRSLPSGLNALYHRMLTKIEGMCGEDEYIIRLVRKIFTWVALAVRPLTLAELRIALAIEPGTECLSSIDPLQNISNELLTLCGSFVEIMWTDNKTAQADGRSPDLEDQAVNGANEDLNVTVRLTHQSAKEYLSASTGGLDGALSKFGINSQAGSREIAQTCLTYLLCKDFEDGPIKETAADSHESYMDSTLTLGALIKRKLVKYEFLDYAALHWPAHVRECEGNDVLLYACKFLSDSPEHFQSWYQVSFFIRNSEVNHNSGFASIHSTACWALPNVLRLLLDRGAEINVRDTKKRTALHWAALDGHMEVVKLLLHRGAEIDAKDTNNWTALHNAAYNGHQEVANLLLDRGAEIDARDINDWTAFRWPAQNGHVEVAKLLLGRGAEINAKDANNWTPLHDATGNGHVEVVNLLLNRGAVIDGKTTHDQTALHHTAQHGHVEVIKILLDRGVGIDIKDANKQTALHFATLNGHAEVARLLLDRGAGIDAKDTNNWTPLHDAADNGHWEVVKLLLDRGAEIDARDIDDWTALHWAAQNGHVEVAKLLLDRGAEIGAKDTDNLTALYYAAQTGHVEVFELLLDRGAVVDGKPTRDQATLHVAAWYGHLKIVKLLLGRGAEVGAKDANNRTALHFVALNGHAEVVRLLLDRGAEVDAKDTNNWTPLHNAAEHGHLEVVKLLLDRGHEAAKRHAVIHRYRVNRTIKIPLYILYTFVFARPKIFNSKAAA